LRVRKRRKSFFVSRLISARCLHAGVEGVRTRLQTSAARFEFRRQFALRVFALVTSLGAEGPWPLQFRLGSGSRAAQGSKIQARLCSARPAVRVRTAKAPSGLKHE